MYGVVLDHGLTIHDYYDGADSSQLLRAPDSLLLPFRGDSRKASLSHSVSLFSPSPRLNTYACFHNATAKRRCLNPDFIGPRLHANSERSSHRHATFSLMIRLPSLQRINTDLDLGLRPFSRPPYGVASNLPSAIPLDRSGGKAHSEVIIPNVDLMKRLRPSHAWTSP